MKHLLIIGLFMLAAAQVAAQRAIPKENPIIGALCKRNAVSQPKRLAPPVDYPRGYFNYYVHHYTLRLTPDFVNGALAGVTEFHFKPTGPLDTLVFDLSTPLGIDSIAYHGQSLNHIRAANQLVLVPLPTAVLPMDTLKVWYSGIPNSSGLGTISFGSTGSGVLMATLSEPYGARDWWATRQDYNQKIDSMDVYLTTPANMTGVSNGLLAENYAVPGGMLWHWRHRYPIVNYLVATAVTNYAYDSDTVQLQQGVMKLENFSFPANRTAWRNSFGITKSQLRNYEKLFRPYPFFKEKYGHTQFLFGGGQEHQTNSFMDNVDFDLQCHELAHQWFGDYITCKGMNHIWLNESWATYCEYLSLASLQPTRVASWLSTAAGAATRLGNTSVYKYDTADVWGIFDYYTTYKKGGMVLHTLRRTIGDQAFFTGVKNYLADPALAYNLARTGDFMRHMSAAAGRPLDDFFNAWIYGKGYPIYSITGTTVIRDTMAFNLSQAPVDTNGSFFPGAIAITIVRGVGRDTVIYVNHTQQGQLVKFATRYAPTRIRINGSNESITTPSTVTVTSMPTANADNEFIVMPNPAQDRIALAVKGTTVVQGHLTIMNSLGQTVVAQDISTHQPVLLTGIIPGHYQLRFVANGQVYHQQLVKQ